MRLGGTRGPKLLFAAGLVALALVLAGLVVLVLDSRRDCGARVQARADHRVMWLYALEQNPTNPRAVAFREVLDERIPALECKGIIRVHAEPVEEP